MTEFTRFQALAFDLVDGRLADGQPVDCESPALAIQTAQGQWKVLGHAGAVALSSTSDFEKGRYRQRHVLRRFGHVPDEYLRADETGMPEAVAADVTEKIILPRAALI
jgi:hypothetical protein